MVSDTVSIYADNMPPLSNKYVILHDRSYTHYIMLIFRYFQLIYLFIKFILHINKSSSTEQSNAK